MPYDRQRPYQGIANMLLQLGQGGGRQRFEDLTDEERRAYAERTGAQMYGGQTAGGVPSGVGGRQLPRPPSGQLGYQSAPAWATGRGPTPGTPGTPGLPGGGGGPGGGGPFRAIGRFITENPELVTGLAGTAADIYGTHKLSKERERERKERERAAREREESDRMRILMQAMSAGI